MNVKGEKLFIIETGGSTKQMSNILTCHLSMDWWDRMEVNIGS